MPNLKKPLATMALLAVLLSGCTTGGASETPPTAEEPQGSLTIFTLYEVPAVHEAAQLFATAYPDVDLQLEVADLAQFSSYEDIYRVLNTEILAGAGPDILVLDDLPVEGLVRSGALMDLTGVISTEGVYPTLLEHIQINGGIYYIPTGLQMPAIISDSAQPAALDSLLQALAGQQLDLALLQTANRDETTLDEALQPTLWYDGYYDVIEHMWHIYGRDIFVDNAIDERELTEMLGSIDAVVQQLGLRGKMPSTGRSTGFMLSETVQFTASYTETTFAYLGHRSRYGIEAFNGMADLLYMQYIAQPSRQHSLQAIPTAGDGIWTPTGMLGVNTQSNNQAAALAFIECALSPEVQGSLLRDTSMAYRWSLPVTADGSEAQFAEYAAMFEEFLEDGQTLTNPYPTLVQQLTAPDLVDGTIRVAVFSAAQAVCEGEASVEQAVEEVKKALQLYMAERS